MNPDQYSLDEDDSVSGVGRGSFGQNAGSAIAATHDAEPTFAVTQAMGVDRDIADIDRAASVATAPGAFAGKRWWLFAAVSAFLLTSLTVAGVYLVTKKPSTVDQLVILTVPSGADIKLDSKDYGHSPVKLEGLAIGVYSLTISKEGYESIVQQLPVAESGPVEFKLKPVPPEEVAGLPPEEQIRRYQQLAEEAFARGYYGIVFPGSALYYTDNILSVDPSSSFAAEMRERIRKSAHQSALSAISRGDLGQAQEVYNFLVEYYPADDEARMAAAKLENQLSRALGQVRELVRKADEALQAGRLIDPVDKSAYFFSKQALAIDRQNEKARQIRNQVKETLVSAAEQANKRGDIEAAIKQLEQVGQMFPEDKQSRARVRDIKASHAADTAKVADPNTRRVRGLDAYSAGNYEAAIPDRHAVFNGQSSPAVVFALARSI
jgi:hypothetical protein